MAKDVTGVQKTTQGIMDLDKKYKKAAYAALNTEAELILTEAKILAPYITGHLKDNTRITVRSDISEPNSVIEFLADYAYKVHEEPRPPTSNGTFKYLEMPLKGASSGYAKRLQDRMDKIIAQQGGA